MYRCVSLQQQKERCKILEEELVDLVVIAMERSEKEDGNPELQVATETLWQHLSSQIIIFVLFQFASFPHMVKSLHEKVRNIKSDLLEKNFLSPGK